MIAIIYLTRVGEVVDLRRVEKNRKMENGKTGRFNLKYTEKKETEIWCKLEELKNCIQNEKDRNNEELKKIEILKNFFSVLSFHVTFV